MKKKLTVEKIQMMPYKRSDIAGTLGISRQSLNNKMIGIYPFTEDEIKTIDILYSKFKADINKLK